MLLSDFNQKKEGNKSRAAAAAGTAAVVGDVLGDAKLVGSAVNDKLQNINRKDFWKGTKNQKGIVNKAKYLGKGIGKDIKSAGPQAAKLYAHKYAIPLGLAGATYGAVKLYDSIKNRKRSK